MKTKLLKHATHSIDCLRHDLLGLIADYLQHRVFVTSVTVLILSCCRISVSYTHLTLPTIYSV